MVDSGQINQAADSADPFAGMPDEEVTELLEVFYEDLAEKLDQLSNYFIELEENPASDKTINDILKIYHSIKGTGGTFGYPAVSVIAHRFETVFDRVHNDRLKVDTIVIDKLLQSLDLFKQLNSAIKSRKQTVQFEHRLQEILEYFDLQPEKRSVKDESASGEQEVTAVHPSGTAVFESTPEKEEEYIKLQSVKVDKLVALASELMLRKYFDEVHLKKIKSTAELLREYSQWLTAVKQINGETGKLFSNDNFELMHFLSQLEDISTTVIYQLQSIISETDIWNEQTGRLVTELYNETLQTRMVTLNEYFRQLKRTVRDVVKSSTKKINLQFSGLYTELDRRIIEKIKDPMIHLIRNAIDHGIETPEERLRTGKPAEGKITISAHATGKEITIIIEDDGKGIDGESIKTMALQKHLYSREQLQRMSLDDSINLIFLPGFSTKNEVSQISGRGVGLDVVKSNIEKISGSVAVETAPGKGTRFVLKIPITLAAFQAILCRVDVHYFYIQSIAVDRVIRVVPGQQRPADMITTIAIGSLHAPYIYLGDYFSIKKKDAVLTGGYIILLRSGDKRIAIEVDQCLDHQDIVIKPKADIVAQMPYISGFSFLSNGNVAYVLEPVELITHCEERYFSERSAVGGKEKEPGIWQIAGVLPYDFHTLEEISRFNVTGNKEKLILLHFMCEGRHYGIPVQSVNQVCSLSDKALIQQLESRCDTLMVIEDGKVTLLKQKVTVGASELPRAGILINIQNHCCILFPDRLINIDIIDPYNVQLAVKEGEFKAVIPDIVLLESPKK
jgi:two-component system chemotaxis sensor kinase CheA